MSRTREAYLKYLSISQSKYIRLVLKDGQIVNMSLKPERFPHLIGIQYLPAYKKIPANDVNTKILANDVLDDKTVNQLSKSIKSMIIRKSKTIIGDFNIENAKYAIPSSTMTIGVKVNGDLFMISMNKSNSKYFIVSFKRDKFSIYHPVSAMQTSKNDKKIKQLHTLKWIEPESVEHLKKLKEVTKNLIKA